MGKDYVPTYDEDGNFRHRASTNPEFESIDADELTVGGASLGSGGGYVWSSSFPPLPEGRRKHAAAVVNGKLHIAGGYDVSDIDVLMSHYQYDPIGDTWTQLADMPGKRRGCVGGEIDGKFYVTGGNTGNPTGQSDIWAYDPNTDSWDESLTAMPSGRYATDAAVADDKLYVVGGQNNNTNYISVIEEYDPNTDSWRSSPDLALMPGGGRRNLSCASLDGFVYAIGGYDGSNLARVERFDVSAETWESRNSIPRAVLNGMTVHLAGGLILAGGRDNGYYKSTYRHNPSADSWTQIADMPAPRARGTINKIDTGLIQVGGQSGTSEDTNTIFEFFQPLS